MAQLYLTFFAIGLLVFAAIVAYSWLQQSDWRKQRIKQKLTKKKYDDPIFVEDKSRTSKQNESTLKEPSLPTKDELSDQRDQHKSKTESVKSDKINSKQNGISVQDKMQRSSGSIGKSNPNHTPLPVVEMTQESSSATEDSVFDDAEIADNIEIINAQPKRDKSSSSIVTELVARVNNEEPIEQKDLLTLFRNHDFKFHRKVHIYGLNQLTDLWRDIEFELPTARFVELGVAIQLADRDGAMTNKELHDFQQMALEFSNHFDAPFEFSMDIDEALIQAKVLDQIGRRYDSMAVLNVVPRSKAGFRVADIESCARDLDMTRSKKGIFLKTTGQKNQISISYRLACTNSSGDFGLSSGNTEPIHDLVIYMNVPATNAPETVFQNMVKDANSLATWLEGKVVDKDGKVMTQRSYSVLTQQISDISFSMQQDGLIPGDSVCKKLF